MKKGIHPENYRPVVFKDMSNGDMFQQARRHGRPRRQVHEPLR